VYIKNNVFVRAGNPKFPSLFKKDKMKLGPMEISLDSDWLKVGRGFSSSFNQLELGQINFINILLSSTRRRHSEFLIEYKIEKRKIILYLNWPLSIYGFFFLLLITKVIKF
jgi:hypothetical protein